MGVRPGMDPPDAHFFLSHSIGGTNRFPCLFVCHSHRSTCQREFRVPIRTISSSTLSGEFTVPERSKKRMVTPACQWKCRLQFLARNTGKDRIRSVVVVLPASMCAMMPKFLVFSREYCLGIGFLLYYQRKWAKALLASAILWTSSRFLTEA